MSSLAPFELTRVDSLREACAILADPTEGAVAIAGGTQLLIALRNQTHTARRVVDLGAIPGLDRLEYVPETGLHVGAGVTLARLAADRFVGQHYPALAAAVRSVGTAQLQAMGTAGGNLCQDTCCIFVDRLPEQRNALAPCHKLEGHHCHVVSGSDVCWANYAGDLAPILLALEASISVCQVHGAETRPLEALFSHDGTHPLALAPGELVTAIHVPPPAPRSGASYLKLRQRSSLDYPLLGVAAAVSLDDEGKCASARVALTGVDRAPVLVPEASVLVAQPVTDALLDGVAHAAYRRARPVKNAWGYAVNYRMKMTRPFVARALRCAFQDAEGQEVRP